MLSAVLDEATLERFDISEGERRVLQILLGGATNQQIAERLVISRKTVESHLYSVMAKTELTNRSQVIVRFTRPWSPPRYVMVPVDDLGTACF